MAPKPSLPDVPALIVVGGPTDGEVFPLEKDRSLIVGSGRLANLRLGPSDISSAHLKVGWDDTGLFVTDNTSFTGTFLNGESIEQAPLQEGDLVAFADPHEKPDWPKLRVHIPPGSIVVLTPPAELELEPVAAPPSVPAPPPPAPATPVPHVPPTPRAARPAPLSAPETGTPRPRPGPRPTAGRTPARGKAQPKTIALPVMGEVEPKMAAAMAGGALGVVLVLWLLIGLFFGPKPLVETVQPAGGEPGQTVAIRGDRFGAEAANNLVRFGEAEAKVTAASETGLTVVVPDAAVPGEAELTVQVRRRRSKPAAFRVLKALRVSSLQPDVALPGEEVLARGSGLDSTGLVLTVEGKPAQVLEAAANSLRFKVPALAAQPVRAASVLLKTNEQVAKPVELMIGRLPLVLGVSPRSVEAGDRVTLKGRGFAPQAAANRVQVGRTQALVVAATPTELTLVAPDLGAAGQAPILVEALGRSASATVPLQIGAGSSATYRLRFFAAPADGPAQACVAIVAGPVLLLASKDDTASVEERALRVASALNALADAASQGRPAAVELRNPSALASVGGAVIARVTAEDAAAYASAPQAVATHWAALVGDYLGMFGRGERPTRLFTTTGRARALLDLQSEVNFRPGVGVAATRMAQLSDESHQKLKDLALQLTPPAQGQAASAVEGVWEGEMRDADGVVKAVSVEIRLAGDRLSGTLILGTKVAMRVPLQDLNVQGGNLRFNVRRSGKVLAFESPVSSGEVAGSLHEGSLAGPAVGRLTLRYARPPG